MIIGVLLLAGVIPAAAQNSGARQGAKTAQICPAAQINSNAALLTPPRDWSAPECEQIDIRTLNPTGKFLWVRYNLQPEQPLRSERSGPTDLVDIRRAATALYLSGRFSSQLWLNGSEIGQNGTPGLNKASEVPGRMDAAFAISDDLIRPDDNELIMLVSAHHGVLNLAYPLHNLRLGAFYPHDRMLARLSAPIMIVLGFYGAGLVYFGSLSLIRFDRHNDVKRDQTDSLIMAAICALASLQLMAEIARLFVEYSYPYQDLRLIVITASSAAFGLLICFYIARRILPRFVWIIMFAAAALCLWAVVTRAGFDGKASAAMMGPLGLAFCIAAFGIRRAAAANDRLFAIMASAALSIFIGINIFFSSLFLDAYFFYLVAILLFGFLVEQAVRRAREARVRFDETDRANRLQLLLDQIDPAQTAQPLIIRSAGRVEHIPVQDIVRLQGADGYTDIVLISGRTVLHTQSLAALEADLPASFLKVHRSHIVNTHYVRALERDPSGTGSLILSTEARVPVSRRILPSVRVALG